ncbi:MAG: S8/S53 family peptidase [Actinobacteria bacterium]|nr:S8/S53 family peptidase [Actinomycetota bacterium]
MAMLMAAPQNGWGMVGIAPTAVRVYSIRVLPPGGTTFTLASYSYALNRCEVLRGTSQPGMTVVNLSLGGTETPTTDELRFMQDAVETARERGLNVVAAAGNGGIVTFPASYPPVVAVGAGDAAGGNRGVLCDFSKGGGLDIIAPGCNSAAGGVDQAFEDDGTPAFGFGTSQAAAITSSVLAAMRAYAPTLSILDAESCLTRTEINSGSLDAAGAFRACGLARVVDAGLASSPSTSSAQSGGATTESFVATQEPQGPPVVAPLATPRLAALHLRHGKLLVRVLNRPRGASIDVELMAKRGSRMMVIARKLRSSRVTFDTRWARSVRVRFLLPGAQGRASAWISRTIQ